MSDRPAPKPFGSLVTVKCVEFLVREIFDWPFAVLYFHSSFRIVGAFPDHPSFEVFFVPWDFPVVG